MAVQSVIKNAIVLVPFPFDDFSFTKVRPALCLTSEIGRFNHVIIAFISSRIADDLTESDLIIQMSSKNSLNTGLKVDSVIRLHKMVTIPKRLIIRKLGEINPTIGKEVSRNIKQLFSIQ